MNIVCTIFNHDEEKISDNWVKLIPDELVLSTDKKYGYPRLYEFKCKRCGNIRIEGSSMPDILYILRDLRHRYRLKEVLE